MIPSLESWPIKYKSRIMTFAALKFLPSLYSFLGSSWRVLSMRELTQKEEDLKSRKRARIKKEAEMPVLAAY